MIRNSLSQLTIWISFIVLTLIYASPSMAFYGYIIEGKKRSYISQIDSPKVKSIPDLNIVIEKVVADLQVTINQFGAAMAPAAIVRVYLVLRPEDESKVNEENIMPVIKNYLRKDCAHEIQDSIQKMTLAPARLKLKETITQVFGAINN